MNNKNVLLGAHTEFKAPDYLINSNKMALEFGANAMMIYLGAPQNSKRVDKEKYHLKEYLNESVKILNENIVVHAPYITNCANPKNYDFNVEFLVKEINNMNYIGAKYMVLHPGAYTGFTKEIAYETLFKSLNEILLKTENVIICLETMSGKGTQIGNDILELSQFVKSFNSNRIAICLDTCHVWDANYNIKQFDQFLEFLKNNNVLKQIKVIHLNDSKNDIGSKKDRHANLNDGFIGLETLKKFVFNPEFRDIIKILETPWVDDKPPYKKEIELILK